MEVDEEIEADLLRQFNCLNTSDKDVLVKELQSLLGRNSHVSEQTARFYLDMADWNLQVAIGAYFDLQSSHRLPHMTFIQDVTIGEGESVPPNTSFIKTWRVENTGSESWPPGCRLLHTGGDRLGAAEASDPLATLPSRTKLDVSMRMVAPQQQGLYSSKWRMTTQQGLFFGDTIWVIIQVDDGGTLALMQQMVNLKELGSSPPVAPPPSPAHAATACSPPVTNPFSPHAMMGGISASPAGDNPFIPHATNHSLLSTSCPANPVSVLSYDIQPITCSIQNSDNNMFNNIEVIFNSQTQPAPREDGLVNPNQCYFASSTTTNTITSSTGSFPSSLRNSLNAPLPSSYHISSAATCFPSSASNSSPIAAPSAFNAAVVVSSEQQQQQQQQVCSWLPDADHDVTMS